MSINVSVIMTTYNAAIYVIEALRSIVNQSHKDLEIVIVDDGSTDDTVRIVQYFCAENPLVKINLFPINHVGRAAVLNYAISVAQYDWIAILDADDLWHIDKLKIQMRYIENFNISFLATRAQLFYSSGDIDIHSSLQLNISKSNFWQISPNKLLISNLISHSSVLCKKELLKYNPNRKYQIDYEMWLRLAYHETALYFLNNKLTYHRLHPGQSFESRNRPYYIMSTLILQLKYCLRNLKFFYAFLVVAKFGYYTFLPRKLLFFLKNLSKKRPNNVRDRRDN